MQDPAILGLTGWEIALLAVSGYVAVVTLAGLMRRERERLLDRFRREMVGKQLERKREEQRQVHAAEQRAA